MAEAWWLRRGGSGVAEVGWGEAGAAHLRQLVRVRVRVRAAVRVRVSSPASACSAIGQPACPAHPSGWMSGGCPVAAPQAPVLGLGLGLGSGLGLGVGVGLGLGLVWHLCDPLGCLLHGLGVAAQVGHLLELVARQLRLGLARVRVGVRVRVRVRVRILWPGDAASRCGPPRRRPPG